MLLALKNGYQPLLSRAADVYNYEMICYELLTACIPFGRCAKSNYDIILSGRRPKLPADLNHRMKKLLRACWRAELQDHCWVWIIQTLKEEEDRIGKRAITILETTLSRQLEYTQSAG